MSSNMGYRPLADMEGNGVYFEDNTELYLIGDESLFCYYSGLPAVSSYNNDLLTSNTNNNESEI